VVGRDSTASNTRRDALVVGRNNTVSNMKETRREVRWWNQTKQQVGKFLDRRKKQKGDEEADGESHENR